MIAGNVLDECGVCGGEVTADGACDCDGNVLDECGVCGGEGIADGACDCDGNVLDECAVCAVAKESPTVLAPTVMATCSTLREAVCGETAQQTLMLMAFATTSTSVLANSTNAAFATVPAPLATVAATALQRVIAIVTEINSTPSVSAVEIAAADADGDGICDDEDDCVGAYDECGVCNGDGIGVGECDCDGNVVDALGVCGGDCLEDANGNGICDDEEECLGTVDECGICDGPGAIYECGCSDIPVGDCDCNGSQLGRHWCLWW